MNDDDRTFNSTKLHEDAEKAKGDQLRHSISDEDFYRLNKVGDKVGADAFLHTVLGNKNITTLTFLSLTKLLEAYAEHLLVTIGRQAEQLKAKDAALKGDAQ